MYISARVVNGGTDQPIVTFAAESATFRTIPEEEKLSLKLNNGSLDREGKILFRFDEYRWNFSLADLTRKAKERDKPSDLPLSVIADELDRQILKTKIQYSPSDLLNNQSKCKIPLNN